MAVFKKKNSKVHQVSSGELLMVFVLGRVQIIVMTQSLKVKEITHFLHTVFWRDLWGPQRGHYGMYVGSWEAGYSSDKKYIECHILWGLLAFWLQRNVPQNSGWLLVVLCPHSIIFVESLSYHRTCECVCGEGVETQPWQLSLRLR